MNTNDPFDNPDALGKTLREWHVNDPLPPGFQENVWRRIALADARTRSGLGSRLAHGIEAVLPRPVVAGSYVSLFLVFGVVAGYWQAQSQVAQWNQSLGLRYVQAIDPYQNPRR